MRIEILAQFTEVQPFKPEVKTDRNPFELSKPTNVPNIGLDRSVRENLASSGLNAQSLDGSDGWSHAEGCSEIVDP